jgi:hypothetical protein
MPATTTTVIGHRDGGHDDEGKRHAALDGDDLRPSVGDGEADVDGRDHGEPERVDRRALEPPEDQRRGGRQQPDDDPPRHGGADRARCGHCREGGNWAAHDRAGRGVETMRCAGISVCLADRGDDVADGAA